MTMPLPPTLSVVLTLKVGEPFDTSYGAPHPMELVLDDGYLVFRARVRRLVDKLKEIEWPEAGPILLKPTISASQAKFVALAESDGELSVQLTAAWNLAAKRKTGQAVFKLELYIYASRGSASTTIRRATEGHIAAATSLIGEHVSALPAEEQLGEASRAYWAVSHARQPEQTPLVMPTNTTFTRLQRIDALQRDVDGEAHAQASSREFMTVRCRLNGGMVPLDLNVADLREALSLPSYDLRPLLRPPIPSSSPTVNVEDVDHMSDAEHDIQFKKNIFASY